MSELPESATFLCSSTHRAGVLTALYDSPADRRTLKSNTGASQPTISRILTDFERRHWVARDGREYRLTELGAMVADRFIAFTDMMTTEQQLRAVWPWLPHDVDTFSIDLFSDIVVSHPGPAYPYQPLERLTQLISDSTIMKGFGMAVLKSGNLDPFFEGLSGNLECEYIYPPAVFAELLSWNRERVLESIAHGNYTVYVHDDLPIDDRCGICLFDERTSICCYDDSTGIFQSLIDTESERMKDWAETYYSELRTEARRIDGPDDLFDSSASPELDGII